MRRLALISDTHLPFRLAALPDRVFELLSDCDLILHAGDVGDFVALDELARIAPVVGVRGNDEGSETIGILPIEQLVVVGTERILLWHGHFEDRSDELAWRHAASWPDIIDRIARRARARAATIAVTGHTHIPLALEHRGVLLVNPGALAPGNAFLVQTLRSVAVLDLGGDGRRSLRHVNVDTGETFEPALDPDRGFDDAAACVQRSLLEDDLRGAVRDLGRLFRSDVGFRDAWLKLAHEIWSGERREATVADARAILAAGGPAAKAYAETLERQERLTQT